MSVNLDQKERMLLEDQKQHEQLCIQKYNRYANQSQDVQLKQLFQSLASAEQQHLNTINQILSGQVPNMNQGGPSAQNQGASMQAYQSAGPTWGQTRAQAGAAYNQNDSEFCTDMLTTEKYISGTYDTTIFECRDTNVRQALNHIQKEEQEHGQKIYDYMQSNGLYNVQ